MHVSLNSKEIAPQLLHVLNFDLYDLNPINVKSNNKRGTKNKRIIILPRKLIKNLIPKIGIIINMTNE